MPGGSVCVRRVLRGAVVPGKRWWIFYLGGCGSVFLKAQGVGGARRRGEGKGWEGMVLMEGLCEESGIRA